MKNQFLIAFLMFIQIINGQSVFNSELIKFIENDSLSSSIIGLELMDGKNGEIILEHNANKLLVPASIQKLYTTSYAQNILGLNYSFNTTVFTNGEIDDQTLNGDLFISLSGDPSLESRFFDSISFFNDLKNSLTDLNVKTIKGQLVLLPKKDDYQVNSQWLWGDLGNYYGGGYSTHTFKDNYVEVFFNSTDSVGEITSINELYPSVSNFTIDNRVVGGVINKDLSYAFGAPYQKERRMNGEIPINKNAYKHIAALTLCNEGTIRDWVRHAKFNVTQGKNWDKSGAIGPCIVPFIHDSQLDNARIITRVNGEVRQDDILSNMVFPVRREIEYISTFMTLEPGDIIVTGTPTGSGARLDPPQYLKPGDVVEVEVDGIGILRNTVEDEKI